jgi:hypothetical protein
MSRVSAQGPMLQTRASEGSCCRNLFHHTPKPTTYNHRIIPKMNRNIIFSFICLALFIVIISCNFNSPNSETREIRTEEEAMHCMDIYIDSVRNLSAYAEIMQALTFYLKKDSIIQYAYGMNNTVKTTIDSAILLNDSLTYCCCLLIVQTPKNTRNDYIDKFNGIKVNNQWIFSEGMHFSYKRPQDSFGNYVPYTLDYLSTNVRMEFIKDGFIRNKDCEIDWKYVDKWR